MVEVSQSRGVKGLSGLYPADEPVGCKSPNPETGACPRTVLPQSRMAAKAASLRASARLGLLSAGQGRYKHANRPFQYPS